MKTSALIFRFRIVMLVFIIGLVLSGVTAFPLLYELDLLAKMLGVGAATSTEGHTGIAYWILTVKLGLGDTYAHYPGSLMAPTGSPLRTSSSPCFSSAHSSIPSLLEQTSTPASQRASASSRSHSSAGRFVKFHFTGG
jgi:hypothetical protein